MFELIICVLCSVSVSVFLKLARKKNIAVDQAIAVNYVVAIGLTLAFLSPKFVSVEAYMPNWPIFVLLGFLMPSVFLIMAAAVRSAGIVKSDAAQRLSLFIPILSAFLIFGEALTVPRMVGIALAFVALFCLLAKTETGKTVGGWASALPLLGVWLGYGVIDVMYKQLAKSGNAFPSNLLIVFVLACTVMLTYMLLKRTKWSKESMMSGIILGALNFSNILFYLKAHQAFKDNPTLVFAGVNVGVITMGTLVGALIFKEKLSKVNVLGVMVALSAIVCLFYWPALSSMFA